MTQALTIECAVHFNVQAKGRKRLHADGAAPEAAPGRVPRVAKLLALAHRLERLLRDGVVKDYAELGQLGRVTRARISQIMSLLNLAPDIQVTILFLPRTERGRDPVVLRDLLPLTTVPDWKKQRRLWRELLTACGIDTAA